MTTMKISEGGKNGSVTVGDDGLDRVLKKPLGRDDRQFIPYKSITFVEHDRKRMGRDVVALHVGARQFEWKVIGDAEGFVDEVNRRMAGS